MAEGAPEGWHSITPRLFAEDPERLVAFLRAAFDARGELREGAPAELVVVPTQVAHRSSHQLIQIA
jgi:hypothetical protein